MLRDNMSGALRRLGIDRSNYKVLKLLPLVYVAWSDGKIETVQHDRLVQLAHDHFQIGAGGEAILRGWLKKRPSKEYFMEGLHDIVVLALQPDEWEFELDELQGLLSHAEAIARTTAENLDAPTAVAPEEEAALHDIARELEVDDGASWAALMSDLGEGQA